ncbi:hypothetical protein BC628DRAFT_1386625 [Trametes gibbosa]|nr:hypothetical protein BC628DRAFT_1386625 [Trametes gibbosa]
MVSRYSKKKAKYTYAERVLGALSDIQKDHRKHAVHMATLRAQVRKAADARKDKMGPQWSQWVSRTVNKLVDDGILDTSDTHGNIAFTPDAKRTITKVRRESMGPGIALSPGLEHRIWKDVTKRFSGVGVKRRRRQSSAVHPQTLEDDDDDIPPRKRQARKSTSKLTRSKLESELRDALQKLHDAPVLQPANAEELSTLQEELFDREKEVAALRQELARLREDRHVTVGTSTRMVTPPPSNPSLPSSSGYASSSIRARLATHGVTRTLSGSRISDLSKQPTPEPSDGSSQGSDDDVDQLICEDTDCAAISVFPELGGFSRQEQGLGLATPQSSPLLADQEEFCADADEQDTFHGYEEHKGEAEEMDMLKGELASQSTELDELREECLRLLSERDELRASVTSRDDRICILQADISVRDEALVAKESQRAELEKALASETALRGLSEAELRISKSAILIATEQVGVLSNRASMLEESCERIQGEIHSLALYANDLTEKLRSAQLDASESRTALHESEENIRILTAELTGVKQQLQLSEDNSQNLSLALETSSRSLGERTAEAEQTKMALVEVQGELAQARLVLESAIASQETTSAHIAELEHDLEGAHEEARALHFAKSTLERTSGNLQEAVERLREELSHAKGQLEFVHAEVEKTQDVIADLHASHARALVDVSAGADALAASKASVSGLEVTVDMLRAQLQDAAADAAELRKSLETEQASRCVAESELAFIKASQDALLSDLADKTARLSSATEELSVVREAGIEGRRQLRALEERHASQLAMLATERSGLEDTLVIARKKRADLEDQLERATARLSTVSEALASTLSERNDLAAQLQDANAHSTALREHLELAQSDVQDAEVEIVELRHAKAEDEQSIQSLKAGLARLRQLQMDALDEVDSKMISAHTAPTPGSRRRSSVVPRMSLGTRV